MGITSKAGLIVTAHYKDFDKAKSYFGKLTSQAAAAAKTFASSAAGGDPLKKAATPISKQSRDVEANISRMTKMARAADTLGKGLRKSVDTAAMFTRGLFAIGAVFGIDKMVGGISEFYKGLVESQRAATQLNMTLGGLNEFTYGMRQVGIDIDDTVKALTRLTSLRQRMVAGDIVAQRIMGYANSKGIPEKMIEQRTLSGLGQGTNARSLFAGLKNEIDLLGDPADKAARLLMVLGDDAFNLAAAFTDTKGQLDEGFKMGKLVFGPKQNLNDPNVNHTFDETVDRIRRSSIEFDNAAAQLKSVMTIAGAEWMQGAATIIYGINDWMKRNNESLPSLLFKSLDFLRHLGMEMANGFIDLVSAMERNVLYTKALVNIAQNPTKLFDTSRDVILGEKAIDKKWNSRKFTPEEVAKNSSFFQGGVMEGIRNLPFARDLQRIISNVDQSGVTKQANEMIANNTSTSELLNKGIKELMLVKQIPRFPKEVVARQFAGLLNNAESAMSSQSLALPSAQRMFSVDTESLINKINMERAIKGKDPMERLIQVNEAARQLEQRQVDLLERMLQLDAAGMGALLQWGK